MTPWNLLRRTALFQREAELSDTGQIIGWWETRRVPYNLLVGIAGVVSIAVCLLAVGVGGAFLDKPLQRPDPPLFGFVLVYAVIANVFYSGGWLAELIWLRLWRIRQPRLAVLSLGLGLLFCSPCFPPSQPFRGSPTLYSRDSLLPRPKASPVLRTGFQRNPHRPLPPGGDARRGLRRLVIGVNPQPRLGLKASILPVQIKSQAQGLDPNSGCCWR